MKKQLELLDQLKKAIGEAQNIYDDSCQDFIREHKALFDAYYNDINKLAKDYKGYTGGWYSDAYSYVMEPTWYNIHISYNENDLLIEYQDDGEMVLARIPFSYLNGNKDLSRVENMFKKIQQDSKDMERSEKEKLFERLKKELGK